MGASSPGTKSDETLAIEEGRRQLDGQVSELRDVTRRASVLLTVGLAAAAFFGTGLEGLGDIVQPWQTIARILLSIGSVLAGWGALVMMALIGDEAPFMQTDAVQLTSEPGNLRKYLARDYAENVPTGVDTNAARVTHLGTGTIWIAIGGSAGCDRNRCLHMFGPTVTVRRHVNEPRNMSRQLPDHRRSRSRARPARRVRGDRRCPTARPTPRWNPEHTRPSVEPG